MGRAGRSPVSKTRLAEFDSLALCFVFRFCLSEVVVAVTVRPVEGQLFLLSASDEVKGLGRSALFSRGTYRQGVTVLVTGSTVETAVEPVDARLSAADVAFRGGSDYTVGWEVAALIFDAGFGRWLTLVGE